MKLVLQSFILLALSYFAVELACYWTPLLAVWNRRRRRLPLNSRGQAPANQGHPSFVILSACRDGAPCIPGLVDSFRKQEYPADRFRLFLIADNCQDDSASVARSLAIEVYERHELQSTGKGNAISEALQQRLQKEPFDILLVLDIDARVESSFLKRCAAYFDGGALVLSCATMTKNPNESLLTHVGDLIQGLLRLHQEGRSVLGRDAILYGSHGYVLSRRALERLGWKITTGLVAEDMELRLRAVLAGIAVRYAPDLPVLNDVTGDARSVREQRRRWNSIFLPLFLRYVAPVTQQIFRGTRGSLDNFFGFFLFPGFANLFLYLAGTTLLLATSSGYLHGLRIFAVISAILWVADIAYFLFAFRIMKVRVGPREIGGFITHLSLRAIALLEGLFFSRVKNWAPAPHKEEK